MEILFLPFVMFICCLGFDRLNWYLSTHIEWFADCNSKEWKDFFYKGRKNKETK